MATISAKEQSILLESIKSEGLSVLISMQTNEDYASLLNDMSFMKKAIKLNRSAVRYASINLVRELVKTDGMLLENASVEAKSDKITVFNAVNNIGKAIEVADKKYLSSEEIAYDAVKKDWRMLGVVDKKFRGQLDFAELGLDQDPAAKDLINPTLFKNNKTAALRVIDKMQVSLNEFSRGMRKDLTIIGKMTEKDPKNIRYALGLDDSTESKRIASVAVAKDTSVYKYLPESLKQNEDIAIIVVEKGIKDVRTLGPVAYSKKVAIAAVQHNGLALAQYKLSSIIKNYDVVNAALLQNGEAYKYIHKSLMKDRDLLLTAVSHISKETLQKNNPLNFAPKKYRKDVEILLASVKKDPLSLAFAKGKAAHSHSIVLEAAKGNGLAIKYAPKKERESRDVAVEALSSNEKSINYISNKFLKDDKNKVGLISVLEKQPKLYEKFSKTIQQDPEAILNVVGINPAAAKNLPREYAQNKEYMKQLAARSPEAFEQGLSIKLSLDEKFMKEAKLIMENEEAKAQQNEEFKHYSFSRDVNGDVVTMSRKLTKEEEKAQRAKAKESKQEEQKGTEQKQDSKGEENAKTSTNANSEQTNNQGEGPQP